MSENKASAVNPDSVNQISESELSIMQVIWQATEPVSIQFVRDQLRRTKGWQYNTVATFMVRLVDKGFLSVSYQEGRGRTRLFAFLISEDEYLQSHLRQTIKRQ